MAKKTKAKRAAAKKAPKTASTFTLPALAKDETYKGLIVSESGKPLHHVIEISVPTPNLPWDQAMVFTKKRGADLPSLREGSLLRASDAKGQSGWFWMNEECEADSVYAYAQGFGDGGQGYCRKSFACRVRLVRRVAIQ